MRDTRKKALQERQKPETYLITDEKGTTLYKIEVDSTHSSTLQLQHFAALSQLFQLTCRFDRMQAILTEWVIGHMELSSGTWEYEREDLGDIQVLLEFLSRCHRQPTSTELERLLLAA